MDTLDGMRTFALVASEGSFTAAAKRLNMTTKLASKYVRQLEERLGAQLLSRTTRSVSLTDVGRAYFERCRPLLEQFDELEAIVREQQQDLAGVIRISAPTGFGSSNLTRAIEPFLSANPSVSIELKLADRLVSLVDEGFDLVIRLGRLHDSTHIARLLRPMRLVVAASPDYLAKAVPLDHPRDLSRHNCLINMAGMVGNNWPFQEEGREFTVKVSGAFRTDAPRAQAEMAAQEHGVTFLPYYAAQPFLEAGSLVLLFEAFEAVEIGVYALYPSNRHLPARVRALIDHLAENFRPMG